jgi:hypothetical protein
MRLDDPLRDLADDDWLVPARVDAAVMALWDAKWARRSSTVWRWPVWVAACATVALIAALFTWNPTPGRFTAADMTPGNPLMDQELVLVPEPDRAGPLMLMRVRMTRREFSRLGVPMANPDAEGLVDVEVLVGEDGVARSIRRAVAVNWNGRDR